MTGKSILKFKTTFPSIRSKLLEAITIKMIQKLLIFNNINNHG